MFFSWDEWNVPHIASHGVSTDEAEFVIRHAAPPFPREIGDDKHMVWGQTAGGRYLQVVFTYRGEEDVDFESLDLADLMELSETNAVVVYVVHAMPLTPKLLKQYRRMRR